MTRQHSKMRTVVAASTAALCAVALGACTTSDGNPPDGGTVDMTLTSWTSDPTTLQMYQDLAAEFRTENPRLGELTVQSIPFDQYPGQLAVLLSGSDAPDLGSIADTWSIPSWFDVLYDISFLMDDPSFDYDDILPNTLENLTGPGGELYAIPGASAPQILVYNKTAFEEAGLESPVDLYDRGEWTWETVRELSKSLVDSGSVSYGLDFPQWNFAGVPLFLDRAFGAEYWPLTNDGTNECGLADAESAAAFEFLHDLIYVDGSFKKPGSTPSFPSGDTGMVVAAASFLNQLGAAGFEWGIMPQPEGEGPYNPTLNQAAMGAFAAGEDPELAARLAAYLTGSEAAAYLKGTQMPARAADQELVPGWMVERIPTLTEEEIERALTGEPMRSASPAVPVDNALVINTAVRPILDGVWKADADIPAVLEAACRTVTPLQQ